MCIRDSHHIQVTVKELDLYLSNFVCPSGIRPDDIKKERDQALRNLHIKGAYSAQELFDHHRVPITSGSTFASAYCYPYSRKRPLAGYTDHYSTADWYTASLPYTKTVKMEPISNYCYANETAIAAMHSQTHVYPTSSMDMYNTHSYSYAAVPSSQYCEPSYNTPQPWNTIATTETSQANSYAMHYTPTSNTSPVSSPPTPPNGSPHSIYEEGTLIHHSPSASPQSIHEGFQSLPLQSITGSIHLPESPVSDSRSPTKESVSILDQWDMTPTSVY